MCVSLNSIKVDLNKDADHCWHLRCWICVDYVKLNRHSIESCPISCSVSNSALVQHCSLIISLVYQILVFSVMLNTVYGDLCYLFQNNSLIYHVRVCVCVCVYVCIFIDPLLHRTMFGYETHHGTIRHDFISSHES
jgi:hypothetical protein